MQNLKRAIRFFKQPFGFLVLLLFFTWVLMIACEEELPPVTTVQQVELIKGTPTGKLSLSITDSKGLFLHQTENSSNQATLFTVLPVSQTPDNYQLLLTHAVETDVTASFSDPGAGVEVELAIGLWSAEIKAFQGGSIIAQGSGSLTISLNSVTPLSVDIAPVQSGSGSVDFTVNWPADTTSWAENYDSMSAQFYSYGGISTPVSFSIAGSTATYAQVASSGNYLLSLTFLDSYSEVIYRISEIVRVYDNMVTLWNHTIVPEGASTIPRDAGGLLALRNNSGGVDLSWFDNSLVEEKYTIERSDDNLIWSDVSGDLAIDTTSWSDGSVSYPNRYYYRVLAVNKIGSSAAVAGNSVELYAQIYVNSSYSGGNNDGTKERPFLLVSQGLAFAQALSLDEVQVSAGIYLEPLTISALPSMTIKGGYHASDWSDRAYLSEAERELLAYKSEIVYSGPDSGVSGNPTTALLFSGAIVDNSAVIEGLTFSGSAVSSAYQSAIRIENGASPVISYVTCKGAALGAIESYGAYLAADSIPLISDCQFEGGEGTLAVSAAFIDNSLSAITLEDSRFLSQSSGGISRFAIYLSNSQVNFDRCYFKSSNADNVIGLAVENSSQLILRHAFIQSDAGTTLTAGVRNDNSSAKIFQSVIDCERDGSSGVGIISDNAADTIVINNIIIDCDNAIVIASADAFPAALFSNNFTEVSECINLTYIPDVISDISGVNGLFGAGGEFYGNMSIDLFFDADGRILGAMPWQIALGGSDLSAQLTEDITGWTRSVPYSIGLDEGLTNYAPIAGFGNALRFDGGDDYGTIGGRALTESVNSFSVELWISADDFTKAASGNIPLIFDKKSGGDGFVLGLYSNVTGSEFGVIFTVSDSSTFVSRGAKHSIEHLIIGRGEWTHIAASYNNTTNEPKLYINGFEISNDPGEHASLVGTKGFFIGSDSHQSRLYQGAMDEIRFWSTVRSQVEINSAMHRYVDPATPSLEGYWVLNESDGKCFADLSNNRFHGFAHNIIDSNWESSTVHQYSLFPSETITFNLTGYDPETGPITFSAVSLPTSGTLSGAGNTRDYLHDGSASMTDSYQYSVSDGWISSSSDYSVSFSIHPKEIYCAPYGNLIPSDGSLYRPFGLINEALDAAQARSYSQVKCAAGQYDEDQLLLRNGMTLSGGFDSTFSSRAYLTETERVNATYRTEIKYGGVANGTSSLPNAVVVAQGSNDSSAILEGFVVIGGEGLYSSAIRAEAGSDAVVNYSTLLGGSGSLKSMALYNEDSSISLFSTVVSGGVGDESTGIMDNGGSSIYDTVQISGGNGISESYGVQTSNLSDSELIQCSIHGGLGSLRTVALSVDDSILVISGSQLSGGNANENLAIDLFNSADPWVVNSILFGGNGTNNFAIHAENSEGIFYNNVIDGGASSTVYSIFLLQSSPEFINNLITCSGGVSRYGVWEDDSLSDPLLFNSNNLMNADTILYYDEGTTFLSTVNEINSLDSNILNRDYQLTFDSDYRIIDSPFPLGINLAATLLTGAQLIEFPQNALTEPTDMDLLVNRNQDGIWSMGPYEYDRTPDSTMPIPGSGGVISFPIETETTITFSGVGASDDHTGTDRLLYRFFYSASPNISNDADVELNGSPLTPWQNSPLEASVSSLIPVTDYYFNILVKDESGNQMSYQMGTHSTPDLTAPFVPNLIVSTPASVAKPLWNWNIPSDNVGVTQFEYRLNGSSWLNVSSVVTSFAPGADLPDGLNELELKAGDGSDNWSLAVSKSIFLAVAPDSPVVSVAAISSIAKPIWSWLLPYDNSGVTQFEYSLDGGAAVIVASSQLNFSPTVNLPDGNHTLELVAIDAAGNRSVAHSAVTTVQVAPDQPVISGPVTPLANDSPTFDWNLPYDNSGVTLFKYQLDGGGWTTVSFAVQSWTAPTLSDGSHLFELQAGDAVGELSPIATRNIVVDTTGPSVGSVIINSGDLYTGLASTTLTLSASDTLSTVTQMSFSNDGTSWGPWESYVGSSGWLITTLYGGNSFSETKSVQARFMDSLGNISSNFSDTIYYDAVNPTLSIVINGGDFATNNSAMNVTLSAADGESGLSQMRFSNDNVTWSVWMSYAPFKVWDLIAGEGGSSSQGTHTLYVEVRDKALNTKQATDTIFYDTNIPSAGSLSVNWIGTAPNLNETQLNCTWSVATDPGGSGNIQYRLLRDLVEIHTWGTAVSFIDTGLTPGLSYSYTIEARDAAGNIKIYNAVVKRPPQYFLFTVDQWAIKWDPAGDGGEAMMDEIFGMAEVIPHITGYTTTARNLFNIAGPGWDMNPGSTQSGVVNFIFKVEKLQYDAGTAYLDFHSHLLEEDTLSDASLGDLRQNMVLKNSTPVNVANVHSNGSESISLLRCYMYVTKN